MSRAALLGLPDFAPMPAREEGGDVAGPLPPHPEPAGLQHPPTQPAPRPGGVPSPYEGRPWLSSYPASARGPLALPEGSLTAPLDAAADRYGDRLALSFRGRGVTYTELRRLVDTFAGSLAGLGIGLGDRVAVLLPNCPQMVIACLGALRLGAVVVPLDPVSRPEQIGYVLADSGATVAVCLDKTYPALATARQGTALRHVVVTSLADVLPRRARLPRRTLHDRQTRSDPVSPVPTGDRAWRMTDLLRQRPPRVVAAEIDPRTDVALLQYTTATSGQPRGVLLTHRSLLANAAQLVLWLPDLRPGSEVVLAVLPLFQSSGFTLGLTAGLLLAAELVLLPDLDMHDLLTAVDEHRPTLLPGGPALFRAIADAPGVHDHDLLCIRAGVSVGPPLPDELRERVEKLIGGRLLSGHGSVETAALTHLTPADGPRHSGSVGVPLPGTRARILDPNDTTREVTGGEGGELAVTGPQLFAGYWRQPAETRAATTADGYLVTGDLALMHPDGHFTVLRQEADPAVPEPQPDPGRDDILGR